MNAPFFVRWLNLLRGRLHAQSPEDAPETDADTGEDTVEDTPDAPLELPLDGVLDLHTFRPKDVPSLLDEWLAECARHGLLHVRIIHGKGTGVLRTRVHALLRRHPLVESFRLAGEDSGGWGATLATLREPRKDTHRA